MSVRLAVLIVACMVAFLCAVVYGGGLWFFGLVFFWPALRVVGVRLIDEGCEARELEAWLGRPEA